MTAQQSSAWGEAVQLLNAYEAGKGHLDELLDQRSDLQQRWLVMQVFREWHTIAALLDARIQRNPRPVTLNLLRMGIAECMVRGAEDRPKVVHHAVSVARSLGLSKAECGFINGVLRSILREADLDQPDPLISHPEWLRERWEQQFGRRQTRELIEWNQKIPEIHVSAAEQPAYAEATPWPGFYKVDRARFSELLHDLKEGLAYVQDPFTRIPVDLLNPRPGELVLDLCAAPGGKSRLIASKMEGTGRLVLVDRPGKRMERLRENADRFPGGIPEIVASAVEDLGGSSVSLNFKEASFDAVLIDVPCSNTGVIQKRPDVKVHSNADDITRHSRQQLQLLKAAAAWVKPGGRLVYSTCSLEHEENAAVVEAFCHEHPQFICTERIVSFPWECGHDGGGAFLLTMVPGR